MKNIKFINRITDEIESPRAIIGDCVYFELKENRVKTYCDEYGVWAEIINPKNGLIDKVHLPFSNYFEPVQCSTNAPKWTQTIEADGCWRFEKMYSHVLPKKSDYENIAFALENYMSMFDMLN